MAQELNSSTAKIGSILSSGRIDAYLADQSNKQYVQVWANSSAGNIGLIASDNDLFLWNGTTGQTMGKAIPWNLHNKVDLRYFSQVYHDQQNGTTRDISFSGAIPFSNVMSNVGGAWNTSSKRFVAPVKGVYFASFTYYTNNTETSKLTSNVPRPAILRNGSHTLMTTGYGGKSISTMVYLNVGDYLQAGAYNSSFPVNVYCGAGHNIFTVCLVAQDF